MKLSTFPIRSSYALQMFAGLMVGFTLAPEASAQCLNGKNVTLVEAGNGGRISAVFEIQRRGTGVVKQRSGQLTWVEKDARGTIRFRFNEVLRDAWSVYLHDGQRRCSLRLDLHQKQVYYKTPKCAYRPIYKVIRAEAGLVDGAYRFGGRNGRSTRSFTSMPQRVIMGANGRKIGELRRCGRRSWTEIDSKGKVSFRFQEEGYDGCSVYLLDRSRQVRLQIDLHTKRILYSDARTRCAPLYSVMCAKTAAGHNALVARRYP